MEKIKAAEESDVTTTIRLSLPFPLLRIPDGSYELKEKGQTYRLAIRRILRNPEVAQAITGWTPSGDIDIVADRFGRFSFSSIEIQIPYRIINTEMWDYYCPNCRLQVDEKSTGCSACGTTLSPEKSRRPPRTKAKIRAIEIVNKFLDIYRCFFRDYFIEHIRYNDVISYEIEYGLSDGTRASWQENFDVSLDGSVTTGKLVASEETVKLFIDFLFNPEERLMLRDYLLSSSANRISEEEYYLSILEAVIALEITLYDYIIQELTKLALPKDKNTAFLIYVGAYANVKVLLRLLSKDKPQLGDSVYEECEKAITKRNKIMHEAKTEATIEEAKRILRNIRTMVNYVSKLG
jgi:hypothetical protein